MAAPLPKHTAEAIASLARDRVIAAWRYLDAWQALTSAGVPAGSIRECLLEVKPTEAITFVEDWADDGARGVLSLVGANGTGRTFAAAQWVLSRHRSRGWSRWLSGTALGHAGINERERMIAAVADERALVVDDIGVAGHLGDHLRGQVRALIQYRADNGRSTLVTDNCSAAEMASWLGPRLNDRAKLGGGVMALRSAVSLREAATADLDSASRGPEWYAAKRLVELLGCEPVQRYSEDGARLPLDFDVGGLLDGRVRRAADPRVRGSENIPNAEAIDRLGLSEAEVYEEALRVQARVRGSARRVAAEFGFTGDLDDFAGAMEFARRRMVANAAKAEADRRKLAADAAERHEHAARVHQAKVDSLLAAQRPEPAAPDWTRSREGRAELKRLGFSVRDKGGGFWVYYRDTVLVFGVVNEGEAWDFAGRRCAECMPEIDAQMRGAA